MEIESRIQDISERLNFIDYLNQSNILTEDCILLSLGIVNIFHSTYNQSGLQALRNTLEARQEQFPLTVGIIEALTLCLESNKSILIIIIFFKRMVLPKVLKCLAQIVTLALKVLIKKTLHYHPSVIGWKRFEDDVFLVWPHPREDLDLFFNCMSNIVSTS